MSSEPSFDMQAAHEHFSTTCFNQAWDLIEKEVRTPDEEERMLNLSMASLWHWTQRPDCGSKELSIGYWQIARIFAITGRPENATWYAEKCREVTEDADLPPFYLGYSYEALARAAMAGRNRQAAVEYIAQARELAKREQSDEDRQLLLDDLATIL
ncbi:MAG: hypothetical protein MUC34_15950 [Anaerolineae bacterium]|jgi:hypothetical protein|nr:hypothetical protein [Anaerolineae bacterium]